MGLFSFYIDSHRIKENRIRRHLGQWSRAFTKLIFGRDFYNLGASEILQHGH